MTAVPILTYHANNINGNAYQNNDHVALQTDLQLIHQLGLRIISLDQLMDWHQGRVSESAVKDAVVLTCDDGTWFDYYDVDHPYHGPQTSFINLLREHQQRSGQAAHMTNFVIVSPAARITLDEVCLIGKGWWTDEWWQAAQQSGLMTIANHSWDHNHGVLDNNNHNDDSFRCINDRAACDQQIKQAQAYLQQQLDSADPCAYFAYPYGNYSEYLRHQYLPEIGPQLGLQAAFTTEPKHVDLNCDVWTMPRYVCNNDWHDSDSLAKLLINH